MAPEQLLGKGATQQSDIYAFGVLLFEMVTGRLPFSGETPLAIALRRLQEDAPEPRTLFRQLPGHWNATIAACLDATPLNGQHACRMLSRRSKELSLLADPPGLVEDSSLAPLARSRPLSPAMSFGLGV